MKHAGPDVLDQLAPLLDRIRQWHILTEKKPGIFYLKAKAFLHFHDDASGIFADVRMHAADFERFRVSTKTEQGVFLASVGAYIASLSNQSSVRRASGM